MEPDSGHRVVEQPQEDDGGRALHARLLQGDPTAPADLVDWYLEPLIAWLHRTFPGDDRDLMESVATDSILALGRLPARFDPDRLTLDAYLRMDARGDLLNARKTERRRQRPLVPLETVELHPQARNSGWSGTSDPENRALAALSQERVLALRDHFCERDWEVVMLMVDGERRTERFAAILEIEHQPPDERARGVKRAKDRLKGKLKRLWQRTHGDE